MMLAALSSKCNLFVCNLCVHYFYHSVYCVLCVCVFVYVKVYECLRMCMCECMVMFVCCVIESNFLYVRHAWYKHCTCVPLLEFPVRYLWAQCKC